MCIRFAHLREYGVTINVYSGALTPDLMMRFIDRLEPIKWTRWINYLGPTLDLSRLYLAHFPVIRDALAAKLTELHGEAHLHSALVSASPGHELFLDFWPSYVGGGVRYPAEPVAFSTLEAACEWLGLPMPACAALIEVVEEPQRTGLDWVVIADP